MLSVDDPMLEEQEEAEQTVSPILVIHHLLRGRYQWAIPLAIAVGLICALIGRQVVKPTYSSTGSLRIRPTLPRVLVDTQENGELPMYESYVDMQATLLMSEKVADLAVQDPAWVAIAGRPSPDSAGSLIANLRVAHEGELINVIHTDRNPQAAVAAVRAIIGSFVRLYSENNEAAKDDHVKLLESVKATDAARLAELNQQCVDIAARYGSTNLDSLVELKEQELSELKSSARRIELELAAIQSGADPSTQPAITGATSPEVWALNDRQMAALLDKQQDAQMTLRQDREVLGQNNPRVRTDEFTTRALKQQIQERSDFLAKNVPAGTRSIGGGPLESLASLQSQKRTLDADTAAANAELAELGKSNVRLKEITNEQTTLQQQLTETSRSLEELASENMASGRIDVISYGNRAQLQTSKRALAAAAGGSLGALATLAVLVLMELRNRRLHQISDVDQGGLSSGNLTILGALPIISERPVAYNEGVAYAVHKIRAHLQLAAARKDQRVLAITSPLSGDGKTSLVVALGMSFAGSGSRTLLIDGDLIGGGLTARFDAKVQRDVVELIRRNTTVSEGELSHAWEVCAGQQSQLLETLVQLTFLDRDAAYQLEKAQKDSSVGILDAMSGDKLDDCVTSTRWPNLFVLPRGAANADDVASLSPRGFRSVLQLARSAYDIVLVDSGPISGSIEATLAVSEADGTILVVSRGGSAADVRRAATEVQAAGGLMLGIIFNRAKAKDMIVSGFSSSVRSQAQLPMLRGFESTGGAVASALVRASRKAS